MFSSAIERLNARRDGVGDAGEDAGFTLIELMVVLLILAILLAIAIPTFLGVTKSANDRASQSNLNTALTNAKSLFQNNQQSYALTTTGSTYTGTNAALFASSLQTAEPSLYFTSGAVTSLSAANGQSAVSIAVAADGNALILAEQSKSTGNCWYVIDNTQTETAGAGNPAWANVPLSPGTSYGEAKNTGTPPTCSASAAPAASATVVYQSSGYPSI
jgi:type IV pilus assembly protein PilA